MNWANNLESIQLCCKSRALHGMTLTEAFEEYMDELVYRGGPPMRASREAKANTMRIRFEAFMESGSGAGEEGEHPGEGGAR